MIDSSGTMTQASYTEVNTLAGVILHALSDHEASIGMGMLACLLTVARLLNPGVELSDEKEIKFIEDAMDWGGAYFVTSGGKGN